MIFRKRREIESLLAELLKLAGATKHQDHVQLLHRAQRLESMTQGASRQLDRSSGSLCDAVRKLAYRSGNDRKWQADVALAAASQRQNPKAIVGIAEFSNVMAVLRNIQKLLSQLPPNTFEPATPERIAQPSREMYRADDPVLAGEMIPVKSDNVHAVGLDLNPLNPGKSMMRVQYKQSDQRGGKSRRVAGPTYGYHPVSPATFKRLLKSDSPGGWVWDNLRIRGTVAGYRVPYTLLTTRQGHVPRRAKVIAGQQWFVSRTKQTPDGRRTVRSRLPSQRVGPYDQQATGQMLGDHRL